MRAVAIRKSKWDVGWAPPTNASTRTIAMKLKPTQLLSVLFALLGLPILFIALAVALSPVDIYIVR